MQLLDGGRGSGREEDLKGPGGTGLSRATPSSASTQQRITCEDNLQKNQETGGSPPTAPSPQWEKEEHSPEASLTAVGTVPITSLPPWTVSLPHASRNGGFLLFQPHRSRA